MADTPNSTQSVPEAAFPPVQPIPLAERRRYVKQPQETETPKPAIRDWASI